MSVGGPILMERDLREYVSGGARGRGAGRQHREMSSTVNEARKFREHMTRRLLGAGAWAGFANARFKKSEAGVVMMSLCRYLATGVKSRGGR